MDLKGKNILVTGGGGFGVGGGICKALSAYRAKLIINEISEDKLGSVAKAYPDAV